MKILTRTRLSPLVLGGLLVLAAGLRPAFATQPCVAWSDDLADTSASCLNDRAIPRYLGLGSFTWGDVRYLVLNTGNDLALYDISTNPLHPIPRTVSGFGIPNVGDSDYDLMSFSVCDDCRFGVANYKAGMVLFDLGTWPLPGFVDATYLSGVSSVLGSFVFRWGDRVFVLANGAPDDCPGDDATLYEVRDVGQGPELLRESCPHVDGLALKVLGGVAMTGAGRTVLWIGDDAARVHLLEVHEVAGTVILEALDPGVTIRADIGRGSGLAWDRDAKLAVSAWLTSGVELWSVEDPGRPRRLWRAPSVAANRVALDWPLLWTARLGTVLATSTRDVTNPLAPVLLDATVWDPAMSWNAHQCERDYDGFLDPTGAALYLGRYSVAQVFDVAECTTGAGMLVFADGFEDPLASGWSLQEP